VGFGWVWFWWCWGCGGSRGLFVVVELAFLIVVGCGGF